jgi:hypothetical protein
MAEDETAADRAALEKFRAWLQEVEASAADLIELDDLLFARGEPSEPALMERYQRYKRVKAAVALPPGPERIAALQAAKIRDRRKH